MRIAVLAALLTLLGAAPVRGDVVRLKDGQVLEGEILEDTKKLLKIKTRFGTVTLERARIESVEKKETAEQELLRRERATAPADADGWFALYEFAQDKKLKKDAARLLQHTLEVAPEHVAANEAAGRVRHEGRWLTPAERDAAVAAAVEQDMRSKGLVPFEDRWVTPEDRERLEQGLVLRDGAWLTEEAARVADGWELLDGEWVLSTEVAPLKTLRAYVAAGGESLTQQSGAQALVATCESEEVTAQLLRDVEAAIEIARGLLGAPSGMDWLGGSKLLVAVTEDREEFQSFTDVFAELEPKVDERWSKSVGPSNGFYWWDPVGTSATYHGARFWEEVTGRVVHQVGHVLLNRFEYNFKFLPTWADEGFAAFLEHAVLEKNMTSCLATRRYGGTSVDRVKELLPGGQWLPQMRRRIAAGDHPPIRELVRQDFSSIAPDHVTKSMVILEYILEEDPARFIEMLRTYREHWPPGRPRPTDASVLAAHDQAFQTLGWHMDELDKIIVAYCQGK